MRVIRLHPTKRLIGTHVLRARPGEPFPFRVVGPNGRVSSLHRSLEAACARARWHAGTRFVFVEYAGVEEGACWDGWLGRLVEWNAAFAAMGGVLSDAARARQGLSVSAPCENVISFRRA